MKDTRDYGFWAVANFLLVVGIILGFIAGITIGLII